MSEPIQKRILRNTKKAVPTTGVFLDENPEKAAQVRQQPELFDGDPRVRFDRFSGTISLRQFRVEGRDKVIRWSSFDNIESATRGVDHVVSRYQQDNGPETTQTKVVINAAVELLMAFRNESLTMADLQKSSRLVEARFEEFRLFDVRHPVKQSFVDQILSAYQPDSTGRFNPLISRTKAASALLQTTRRLLVDRLIRDKYSYLRILFKAERTIERAHLNEAIAVLDSIDPRHASAVQTLQFVSRYLLSLETIKVASYRVPALRSSWLLHNNPDNNTIQKGRHYRNMVKLAVGKDIFFEELASIKPFADADYKEKEERISQSRNLLQAALNIGELNHNPTSDNV